MATSAREGRNYDRANRLYVFMQFSANLRNISKKKKGYVKFVMQVNFVTK